MRAPAHAWPRGGHIPHSAGDGVIDHEATKNPRLLEAMVGNLRSHEVGSKFALNQADVLFLPRG